MAINLRKLSRTLLYQRSALPAQVLRDMDAIRKFDARHEGSKKTWGYITTAAVVVTLAALFVGIAMPEYFLAFPITAGLIIVAVVKRSIHSRLDLVDRRYEAVANVLPLLESDMALDAAVQVRIDFSASDKRSKFQRKGESRGWKIRYYSDPCVNLRGRFIDGTSFDLTIVQQMQKRSKWKTSASGKIKRKSKQKSKCSALVRLSAKPAKYPLLPQVAGNARDAVQLPRSTHLQGLKITGHRMAMKVELGEHWDESKPGEPPQSYSASHTLAMMLMSLYQVLNLAKHIDKKQNAA